MGEQLKQRDSFDYVNLDTGLYVLKCKEPDIVEVKEEGQEDKKVKNDYNYVVQFNVEGGEDDGALHIERFPHIAQGHIGISKLMMCAYKMEVIGPPPHDSDKFDKERFKDKFMMNFPGRKVVAIIKNAKNKKTGTEFSNIVAFYHINELKIAQEDYAKRYEKGSDKKETKPAGPLPGAQASQSAQTQAPATKTAPAKDDW